VGAVSDDDTRFYDSTYGSFRDSLYASIREAAFGEDIGQNSWLTADEWRRFLARIGVDADTELLEIACGSGGPALAAARETRCRVTGVDLHESGIEAATAAAANEGLGERARFLVADAREPLPFDSASFDALVCIDAWNHLRERRAILAEWHRVLRPGGRVLFTDPITVTGMLTREEMIVRSGSMGEFVFTPPGLDEELVRSEGFEILDVEDVTENMRRIGAARRAARAQHRVELLAVEGPETYDEIQRFLAVVETLAAERRLSRFAFAAAR
jgi:ubiquinone/menaquinone biosynthesis C-methylase UbiE